MAIQPGEAQSLCCVLPVTWPLIDERFLEWHAKVGGRTVLAEMMAAHKRTTREGTVLFHSFYPDTRVMHVLMADTALLKDPPAQAALGLSAADDQPGLDSILTSMLLAANDLADEFGEELRPPEEVTKEMRGFFHDRFTHHVGGKQLNGRPFHARAGIGMLGPAGWALHGWSVVTARPGTASVHLT